MDNRYYFQHLTKGQQAVYYTMAEGLSSLALSFSVPRMEMAELNDLLFRLRLDHPEIFMSPASPAAFIPTLPA